MTVLAKGLLSGRRLAGPGWGCSTAKPEVPSGSMQRLLVVLVALSLAGCATYRDDLDRSIGHYDSKHYDRALALLVVLEPDLDSLSPAERAQYAYYRGMSHFLLEQKHDARHWLARAVAREKLQAGLLRPDEKNKADETLAELNEERLGGASTPAGEEPKAACQTDAECGEGKFCEGGACAPLPAQQDAEAEKAPAEKKPAEKKPAEGAPGGI